MNEAWMGAVFGLIASVSVQGCTDRSDEPIEMEMVAADSGGDEDTTQEGTTGGPASGGTWDSDPGCLDGGCSTGWEPEPPPMVEPACELEGIECAPEDETTCLSSPLCSSLIAVVDEAGVASVLPPSILECMLVSQRDARRGTLSIETSFADGSSTETVLERVDETRMLVTHRHHVDGACEGMDVTFNEVRPAAYFDECLTLEGADARYWCLMDPVTETCADGPVCP